MAATRTRIRLLERDELDDDQRRVWDTIASGPRGEVRGPARLWLHSPELAGLAQGVGEFLRWNTVFEGRLSELAILVTARHYTAHYIWFRHKPVAVREGLAESAIRAIAERRRPDFARDDEATVYEFTTEILTTDKVSDTTLGRVKALFGERGAIELGAIIGYYHLGVITLAIADHPLPEGEVSSLPE